MHDRDCLHRFVFEHYPIRGHLVHLDAAWRALIEHRDYPEGIRDLLGEAVAASLAARRDHQIRRGPVAATAGRRTRASLARAMHQRPRRARPRALSRRRGARRRRGDRAAGRRFDRRRQSHRDARDGRRVRSATRASCPSRASGSPNRCKCYFENSEQLPTRLWLYADAQGASGMLLQRLPGDERRRLEGGAMRRSTMPGGGCN